MADGRHGRCLNPLGMADITNPEVPIALVCVRPSKLGCRLENRWSRGHEDPFGNPRSQASLSNGSRNQTTNADGAFEYRVSTNAHGMLDPNLLEVRWAILESDSGLGKSGVDSKNPAGPMSGEARRPLHNRTPVPNSAHQVHPRPDPGWANHRAIRWRRNSGWGGS
jgi:hypothetical protein